MGGQDYSPKRKELIKQKEFWELQVRRHLGRRVKNRYLKRRQQQAGLDHVVVESLDEALIGRSRVKRALKLLDAEKTRKTWLRGLAEA
jgi:hypothetical protein